MNTLDHRVPPPLVGALVAALMWGIARLGAPLAHSPAITVAALVVALAGVACAAAGLIAFRRARTTTSPLRPASASALVTGGIYRITRNPMYLGVLAVLLAWAIHLASPWALLGLPLFVWYMNRFQIGPEERALSALFGEEYGAYCGRVRRWLGWRTR